MCNELIQQATAARGYAYAPYSGFSVGAAVMAVDGTVFSACNVENASYGLTICAERAAIVQMVAHGLRRIQALAVVADTKQPVSPCGACRQVLAEFGDEDTPIYLANIQGDIVTTSIGALLPDAFCKGDLHAHE